MVIKIASLVKFYTILLLMERTRHGYEIMKELEVRIGKKVSPGQVYPFLELLQKEKFIRINRVGAREKIAYALTQKGREFAKKMLSRSGDLFYLVLKPQVRACAHCGCKVLEGGHTEKIKSRKLTFCCHHCARSYIKKFL